MNQQFNYSKIPLYNYIAFLQQEDKDTKTEEVESDNEGKHETEEMRQAQAYLEAAGGHGDTMGAHGIVQRCYV